MFTVRAVISGMDATDARPTIVAPIGRNMVSIFSGKIVTCVDAARSVLRLIENGASQNAGDALGQCSLQS